MAAVLVPQLAAGDAVRQRLASAVREATGRELSYRALHAGLLPPRLELLGAQVSGATPDAAPFLDVERVAVRLALWPLLVGVVAADPLVVEGATVRVERGADGRFAWPRRVRKAREPGEDRKPEDKAPAEEPETEPRSTFALRTLELREVRLLMEDGRERWRVAAAESRARAVPCGRDRFALDLEVTGAEVDVDQSRAHGDLVLQADLQGRRGAGTYRLDATHADVLFRGYPKPDETPAVFSLNLRREKSGYAWDAPALELYGEPLGAFRETPCSQAPAP